MNTDRSCAEKMAADSTNTGLRKCDSCNRELQSSNEWVCSDHQVICVSIKKEGGSKQHLNIGKIRCKFPLLFYRRP
jgi:hypothetical protein